MLKLDRSKDFGTVTPPWTPEQCDRPAHYEQAGKLFDQYDRLIEPGKPLQQVVPEVGAEADRASEVLVSPAELIRQVDSMPWARFQKEAKRILGKTCPAGKAPILVALKEAIAGYEARAAKRKSAPDAPAPAKPETYSGANGLSWGAVSGEVDLAAWGRGKKEFLVGDLRKAFRAKYAVQFTERRDMRDFLVDQGVIAAHEARQDV